MKMHAKIHMAALCTFFCIQSMEVTQSKINIPTITLNSFVINKLINSSKQNKSDPSLFSRRTKRLHLLQELLREKATINFSNSDNAMMFWHNQNNEEMMQDILHQKLLSFISCNLFKHTVQTNHTGFSKKYPFSATLQLNYSLLHIAITQPPTQELLKTISKFLDQYSVKDNIHNFFDKHDQQQTTDQSHDHSQTSNKKKEADKIDFAQLPDGTQRLLEEIFQDMDNS